MRIQLKSLYICVKNMERAIEFYEEFLGQHVTEKDNIYSVFDINVFRYGLFAFEKMNEPHIYGNNCLPSFEVSDAHEALERLYQMNCDIIFPLTNIGNNLVFEFVDSEGNHIEVTSPAKQ